MITFPWGIEVMLSFFSRLFIISKFPNEGPLESENNTIVTMQNKHTNKQRHENPGSNALFP